MTTQAEGVKPELSVVIASYNACRTVDACLDSLKGQSTARSFETILVDSSDDGTGERVRERHPWVRLIAAPRRLFPGDARNLGLAEARAGVVALLDADCTVESRWVDAVLEAHRSPALLVGGVVENASPGSVLGWAYHFCEFSHWLPGSGDREIAEAPACALSFKRQAYDTWGPFLEGTYCSDTVFHWRAALDGQRVLLRSSIRVSHTVGCTFGGFLRHLAMHRKSYALVKRRERRLGKAARLGHSLLAIVLPVILPMVIGARVARSEVPTRKFFGCLPFLVAGLCVRGWAEFLGFALPDDAS